MMSLIYHPIILEHEGVEKRGFSLCEARLQGTDDYLFLHFLTPVNFLHNGVYLKLEPDTCIITSPHTPHAFNSPECDLVHNWIHFLPSNPDQFLQLGLPINQIFTVSRSHFISPVFQKLKSEFVHKEPYWQDCISNTLGNFFITLARELHKENEFSGYLMEQNEAFKRFRIDLYKRAGEDWTADKMASQLSLSRSRFTVLYHKFFHVSPIDDLITARIEYAKYLLANTNTKISVIAGQCGYTNICHFSRQFKKITGMTPTDYQTALF